MADSPAPAHPEPRFARVYAPRDQVDLYVAASALMSAGIPYYVENEHFARLECLPLAHASYLQPWFLVPAEDASDAAALLGPAEPDPPAPAEETWEPRATPMRRLRLAIGWLAAVALPVLFVVLGLRRLGVGPDDGWWGAQVLFADVLAAQVVYIAALAPANLVHLPRHERLRRWLAAGVTLWFAIGVPSGLMLVAAW